MTVEVERAVAGLHARAHGSSPASHQSNSANADQKVDASTQLVAEYEQGQRRAQRLLTSLEASSQPRQECVAREQAGSLELELELREAVVSLVRSIPALPEEHWPLFIAEVEQLLAKPGCEFEAFVRQAPDARTAGLLREVERRYACWRHSGTISGRLIDPGLTAAEKSIPEPLRTPEQHHARSPCTRLQALAVAYAHRVRGRFVDQRPDIYDSFVRIVGKYEAQRASNLPQPCELLDAACLVETLEQLRLLFGEQHKDLIEGFVQTIPIAISAAQEEAASS